MRWAVSDRCDPASRVIADRHYNRQSIGAPNFVPPGRCLVLRTTDSSALWVTSWPFPEYVRHAWPGSWVNSLFRNEGNHLSSELIREAVAATRWRWIPPDVEFPLVTFIDRGKTKPKKDPGYCYLRAGFERIGKTQGGLVALGLRLGAMPAPEPAIGTPVELAA